MSPKKFNAFISYSHADGEELANALQRRINNDERWKQITFWQDYSQMKYGEWSKQIEDAIDAVEFLVMLITPGALASTNCKDEWMYARKKGVSILPINGKPEDLDFYNNFPSWLKKQHIYHPEKNWERFINDLNSRPEILKVPFMAPRLSSIPNYIERHEKLTYLKNILQKAKDPVAITTTLQGSGGFGKTTLAIALCNDNDVIDTFYNGILWITLGQQKGTALTGLQKLYDAISNENKNFIDLEQAQQHLQEKLFGKKYLIVLDDVWHRSDAESILKAAAQKTVLVTTRMDKLLINAKQVAVDEMTSTEAIKLLSSVSGINDLTNKALAGLAHKLGHWALLLRLTGGQIKARIDEGENFEAALLYVNKRLEKRGLTGFDLSDAEQRNDSVKICLAASIDLLTKEDQQKLYSLGIFPEDEKIPYTVLQKYWAIDDCEELLEKFHKYGLIDLDVPAKTVKTHDILLKYYKICLQDKADHHILLMKRLGSFNTWQNNKHAWQWCIWHLTEAGAIEEAVELLTDYNWIEAKLAATGNLYYLASDYNLVPFSEEIKLIGKALLLSAAVINDDSIQLPHQLYGRLGFLTHAKCKQVSKQALTRIAAMKVTLKPLKPRLEIPDIDNLVFRGHKDFVKGALIDDDNLISWSDDRTLCLWNIYSAERKLIFEGHDGKIKGALIYGDTLVSWSEDNTLRSWDFTSGKTKHVFKGHTFIVKDALIHNNALISWSDDGTIRLWDLLTGEMRKVFEINNYWIKEVFAYDNILIVWFHPAGLKLWNLSTGIDEQIFPEHLDEIGGVFVHQQTLISWSIDGVVCLWDTNLQKVLNVFYVRGISDAFAYKNSLIACCHDQTICLVQLDSGITKILFKGHANRVRGAIIYKEFLISWSDDRTIRLWDVNTGECKKVFEGLNEDAHAVLACEDTLISWSSKRIIQLWDVESGKAKSSLEGHSGSITGAMVWSDKLISWAPDGDLRLWRLNSAMSADLDKHTTYITGSLVYQNYFLSWSDDGDIRLWDLLIGKTHKILRGHTKGVLGAILYGDSLISWSFDHTFRLWDLTSGATKQVSEESHISDGFMHRNTFITWSYQTLKAWDLTSGKIKRVFEGHSRSIQGATTYGEHLISWSDDATICTWDIASGRQTGIFYGHEGPIKNVLIYKDLAISFSSDRTIRSWNLTSGRLQQIFEGHEDWVKSGLFYKNELIGLPSDATLRSWNVDSGRILRVFKGHQSRITNAFILKGILISLSDNEVFVWDALTAEILNTLKSKKSIWALQLSNNKLYLVEDKKTLLVCDVPSLRCLCRYTVDAKINTMQVATSTNRLILGDASGRVHFLEPVGFKV